MELFTDVMTTIKTVVGAVGGLSLLWGGVSLGNGLSSQNGGEIQNSWWKIGGGLVIILFRVFFDKIVVS